MPKPTLTLRQILEVTSPSKQIHLVVTNDWLGSATEPSPSRFLNDPAYSQFLDYPYEVTYIDAGYYSLVLTIERGATHYEH